MRKLYFLVTTLLVVAIYGHAQTNPDPQPLPYVQDFGTVSFSTPKSGMASWTGSGTRPYTTLAKAEESLEGANISIATTNPTNGGGGGQYGHAPGSNGRLTILQSSNATNGTSQAVVAINTTGYTSVSVDYDLTLTIANARTIGVALQYRIGTSGSFTSIVGSAVSYNATTTNGGDNDGVSDFDRYSFVIPQAALNQPNVQLRWITWRGSEGGNSSGIGLDNISVTGETSGTPTNTVDVFSGTNSSEPTSNGSFTLSLSAPAPSGGVTVSYSLGGTTTAGIDYNDPQNGTITIPAGSTSSSIILTTIDDAEYEGTETIQITLTNVSNGYVLGSSKSFISLLDNDTPPLAKVVINQVYGGGGNGDAFYTNDFIELYNYGNTPVSLNGWSVQYASASGSSWQVTPLSGTIPAHSFYLVQGAKGSDGTRTLPAYNALGTFNMSGSVGKVILSNSTTALNGPNPSEATVIDKVGYGSTANGYELAPAPGTSNTTSVRRATDGVDKNNNSLDFVTGDPLPRNTTYKTSAPVIYSLMPPNGYEDIPAGITLVISFDKPVQKGTGSIIILENGTPVTTIDVTSATVVLTDRFTAAINNITLAPGKTYAIQIAPGAFTDVYGNGFAGITNSTGWSFTTYNPNVGVKPPYSFSFENCLGNGLLSKGFTRYSVSGAQQWDCSTFGRNSSNGVEMNGYDGNTNVPNVDWLISPKIDLTNTDYALLSFWSITAFNGKPLQLKISTDYTGGDPALATWTDLNGKFPAEASKTWTESKDINLSRFKKANVHIAFVYTSSDEDGARWTLDDIAIANSTTAPLPSLTAGTTDLQLGYAAKGGNSDKAFTFIGNDLVEDVTLTATAPFLLSKDGSSYEASITYSANEASDVEQTLWVRFAPTEMNKDFTGTVTVSTSALFQTVALKGTSINPQGTLEVVNWNVEWFGSTEFGPTNDAQQEANVIKVFKSLNADIYALGEIVSEERLQRVVKSLEGYDYVIGNFGSHTNPYASSPSPLDEAQKLAFVYKTSVIKNLGTRVMLSKGIDTREDIANPQYNNWSSGRFPLLMEAVVTLNCETRKVNFVLVHAKANTSPVDQSYTRREAGAKGLYDSLNLLFSEENVVILGDFNDDLDKSITDGKTTTSWSAFTTDNMNYTALTLPLSVAGKKSTVSHNDVIDHVVVSNDMAPYYMEGTASIVTDVTSVVSSYGSTTSDHYPVFTRYRFEEPAAPVVTVCPEAAAFCVSSTGSYSIDEFVAEAKCGAVSYTFDITGATTRNGTGNNASGAFNVGVSTITWTATDIQGNSSTCQTTVTVNANPSVTIADAYALPAGTKVNTVYIGYSPASTLTLSASANDGTPDYTYSWEGGASGSSLTVSPTTPTEYTVTATDANGCTATASKIVTVMDVRTGRNGDKVQVCHKYPRKNATLEIGQEGVADHLAHGDQLGGCEMDASITQKAESTEPGLQLAVEALPNPSAGVFTVSFRGGNQAVKAQLVVTDMLGRVVETRNNLQTNATYTLGSDYRNGVYLVNVLHNGERYTLKLVKQ